MKNNKIAVLGGGLWGTVLAHHLSRNAAPVWLWEFFPEAARALGESRRHPHIPGFHLDEKVRVTSNLEEAAAQAAVAVVVLPSQFVRRGARALRRALTGRPPAVVNASKGIEPGTLQTMGEVIASELPRGAPVYTLTGPSFAREVAHGVPTRLLLGGPAGARARKLVRLFDGGALRVDWTPDRKGIELGGSLKNVLAIGCGILDGLAARAAEGSERPRSARSYPTLMGANTKAALITRGMEEMGRLIGRCGGRPETVFGLAGLGDLIATGTSPESRNRAFGEKLGLGIRPAQARREIPTVVEGAEAAESARALCVRRGVPAPILRAIWRVVSQGARPGVVVEALGF